MKPKNLLATCVVAFALGLGLSSPVRAEVVTFPDANLEAAVRQALNQPSGDITSASMLTLTNLVANNRGILDLTGLEYARNLTALNLNANLMTNTASLNALTNLVRLESTDAGLESIAFANSLKHLRDLVVYNNRLRDISPLAGLDALRLLQLDWNNQITNHPVLAGLTNLSQLFLAGNNLHDGAFLAGLTHLEILSLYDNQVRDVTPFTGLTSLHELGLGWNGVTNASLLAGLPALTSLWLNGNSLPNVEFLFTMTGLERIALDYTGVTNISPLTNLTRLTEVNIGENGLPSLPPLGSLTNLVTFMLAGNHITDLSAFTSLPALNQLHLQRNGIQDISPLTGCPRLNVLLLSENPITNLSVLATLTNLNSLQLQTMRFTSLSPIAPLAALPSLWQLDLADNRITDLSPLTNFPALDWLSMEVNHLQEISPLLDCAQLWYVNLKQNSLDTNSIGTAWNVITNLQSRGVTVEYDPQLPPPVPIAILAQPASRSAFLDTTVPFQVVVTGGTPEAFIQWQKDGVDLVDDGRITGATGDFLQIEHITAADAGLYRAHVWDDWAETNSTVAVLLVVTNVAFADPNLEAAVRERLSIPTAPLTPDDMRNLTDLGAGYRGVTNLAGLEAAANLTSLDLSGSPFLRNLDPLRMLPDLGFLGLDDCVLNDLSKVAELRSLISVSAAHNLITDLSPLRALPRLAWLHVGENHLTAVNPLLDINTLTWVRIASNHLETNSTSAAWNVITNLVGSGTTVEYDPQLIPVSPPAITNQPESRVAFLGDNVEFRVAATSSFDLHYRWQRNGVNLYDDSRTFNTEGDVLILNSVDGSSDGAYRVLVWNDFGMTNSRTVTLRVVTSVFFEDPHLEKAVRDQLGISSGPITPDQIRDLYGLDAPTRGITNLAGLEAAANLDWLNLSENPGIVSFVPLAGLPRLTYLYLNNCGLTNIDFLAALTPLDQFEAYQNQITDLSPLLSQPALRWLNLNDNPGMTNFPVLASLALLENLYLGNTGLNDISFVPALPNLRELDFWSDSVQDVSPLTGAIKLTRVYCSNNQLTNIAPIATCTNLQMLGIEGNSVPDVLPLASLTQLWFFNIESNPIHDISFLPGLTNLTWLAVGWTPITNLTPVLSLTNLTDLHIWNLGISDLHFFSPLTNLRILDAGRNQLSSVPPIFPKLREINISENQVPNADFLALLPSVTAIHLNGTGMSNISSLANRTNIHNLGLAGNNITDISTLATLNSLNWVSLWDNKVSNLSPLSGLTNLNYIDLRYNFVSTRTGSPAMTVIQTLQSRGTSVDYQPQKDFILLSAPQSLGEGAFRFNIEGQAGVILQIWRSSALPTWTLLDTITNDTGNSIYTDLHATSPESFYRVQTQ